MSTQSGPGQRLGLIVPLAITVTVAFGVMFYGFSVYLTDSAAGGDFSKSVLSLGYGGAVLVGGLLALPIGRYADRHGIRLIVGVGSVLGFLGMTAFASADHPWQVVAAWWILVGPAGSMTFYEPAFVAIDQWFLPTERPRALAVLTVIGGLSGVVFIPGAERLVAMMGWRPAVFTLGLVLLATGLSTAMFVIPGKGANTAATSHPQSVPFAFRELFRHRQFRLYTLAMMLSFFSAQGIISHRVALFEDHGLAVATVAVWAAVASALSLPGRWLAPTAAVRFRATIIQAAATLMIAAAVLLMVIGRAPWQMAGHFVLFGVAFGVILPLRAMAMSNWYSGAGYGRIMGTQWTAVALAGAAGAPAVGVLRDWTDGYATPVLALAITNLVVAALIIGSDRSPVTPRTT